MIDVRKRLVALDHEENCVEEEDKREWGFVRGLMQRFAMLFYYMHY